MVSRKGKPMNSNAAQIEYWNEIAGPKWVRLGDAMERRLGAVNRLLIERSAPGPGEQVLDIGCGTGSTTLPVAILVGPAGHVLGIDVSAPMLAAAQERLADCGNAELLQADAQTETLKGNFDLVISRFGVMFFTDPVEAFKNIRRAMKPAGRLCFACWAPLADNPHWLIPLEIVKRHLGPGKPRHPHAPGPLAFSDAGYVREILVSSGFTKINIVPEAIPVLDESLGEAARVACIMGPAGALLEEKSADPATRATIAAEIGTAFAPFDQGTPLRIPATVFIVTAIR
jgi:SAM-dependent methyltransferase